MPKEAIALLELYKASTGLPERDFEFVLGLLKTAFQEGVLHQLQININNLNTSDNAKDDIIQHCC